ncbi:hypothetical protein BTR23_05900 [Alkalihalophilus pseudofirmus]|nr:hypothetical protein BTR23_05900 [Alkalihalophilus pseudofirmus]
MLVKRTVPTINDEAIINVLTSHSTHEKQLLKSSYRGSRFALSSFKYKKGIGNAMLYAPFTVGHEISEVVPNSFIIGSVIQELARCPFYYRVRKKRTHSENSLSTLINQMKDSDQPHTIIQIGNPSEQQSHRIVISIEGHNSSKLVPFQQLIEAIWIQNGLNPIVNIQSLDQPRENNVVTIKVHIPENFHNTHYEEKSFYNLLKAFIALTLVSQQSDVFMNGPMTKVNVSTDTRLKGIFPHHRVDLHPKQMQKLGLAENDYVTVWNPLNGKCRRCVVQANDQFTLEDDIQIGLSTKNKLEVTANNVAKLLIQKYPCASFNKIGVMNVNAIKNGNIIVSKNIYDALDQQCTMFEMVNTVTGASFDIHRSNITYNATLDDETVKLNFLQRQFIDYELPPDILSDYYYQKFYTHPKADEQVHEVLKHYENGEAMPFFPYIERQVFKASLQKVGYVDAKLYPLHDYSKKTENRSIFKRINNEIAEKMIRQATLQLKVIRPYSTDEANNIVRVSPHSLKLLGLEETDTIILKNRATEVKVRVLAMDSVDLVRETSIIPSESSMNVSIGIPAPIRNELGLKNVGKIIEVQRCLPYLFRKNLNLQFFSIIAAVLATMSTGLSLDYMIMILCILIPISVYISFSKVRESISND